MMKQSIGLQCACGKARFELEGTPIVSVECCCASCRVAADRLERLPGAPKIKTDFDATPYVLYRKDRVRFTSGMDHLREFRLSPDAGSRRVIACCCNTPVFLEFKGGHWLSLYGLLWPQGERPPAAMRTMTGDLPDWSALPTDIPNLKTQSLGFFASLFGAWASMGFRAPKIPIAGEIDA
jgi:hypothetical protein